MKYFKARFKNYQFYYKIDNDKLVYYYSIINKRWFIFGKVSHFDAYVVKFKGNGVELTEIDELTLFSELL